MANKLTLHFRLPSGITRQATGREAETLLALLHAGPRGITSLECFRAGWAVRLAAYVCDLRKMGVPIEANREPHGGGSHARYHLAGHVEIVWRNDGERAA